MNRRDPVEKGRETTENSKQFPSSGIGHPLNIWDFHEMAVWKCQPYKKNPTKKHPFRWSKSRSRSVATSLSRSHPQIGAGDIPDTPSNIGPSEVDTSSMRHHAPPPSSWCRDQLCNGSGKCHVTFGYFWVLLLRNPEGRMKTAELKLINISARRYPCEISPNNTPTFDMTRLL